MAMLTGVADQEPYYRPWIGPRARSATGQVRWHVMGESHYVTKDPDSYANGPELTRQVVTDWALSHEQGAAFFTRIAAVIAGQDPYTVNRQRVWEEIAFSNFIQQPLSGPREAPIGEQCAEARRAFFAQLRITRPEILLVLGSRAWNQLPENAGVRVPRFRVDIADEWPTIEDAWLYPHRVEGELICTLAVKIVHPSAGFGRWNWKEASQRAQTAMLCHSNILEHFHDRPDWPPTSPPAAI